MDKNIYFAPVKDAPKDTILPKRGTRYSAGYDMFAPEDIIIGPFDRTDKIKLNVKLIMPGNYYGIIENRSSVRDDGIEISCGGIIDADYAGNKKNDGNIIIRLQNHTNRKRVLEKGKAICQCIIHEYHITDDDNVYTERDGGFGSTGV